MRLLYFTIQINMQGGLARIVVDKMNWLVAHGYEVTRVFNPKAFVNVRDFASLDDVVRRIAELDSNPDACLTMLREPALVSDSFIYANVYQKVVRTIDRIVDAPLEESYRRNRDFWGKKYIAREQRLILQSRKNWKMLLKERLKEK